MASSSVGGLSGAFIPVSEDAGMIRAAEAGALSLEKLEAMTCVCSVGLDMIAVPGDTSVETIFGIIADECAIGMINNKTTAVRIIPAIGKQVGDRLDFGGLLGLSLIHIFRRMQAAALKGMLLLFHKVKEFLAGVYAQLLINMPHVGLRSSRGNPQFPFYKDVYKRQRNGSGCFRTRYPMSSRTVRSCSCAWKRSRSAMTSSSNATSRSSLSRK